MRGRIAGLLLGIGATAGHAFAPTVELPAGGLLFAAHDTIAVDNELVTIGLDRIEINYRLRSTAASPRVVPMAFPLPVIDKGALGTSDVVLPAFDSRNPTNFVGFWTTFDGVPVEPDVQLRAHAIGVIDVTARLRALDLPLQPLTPGIEERIAALDPAVRTELEGAGILIEDRPAWALTTVFHWQHVLRPAAATAVRHGYRPVVGSASWQGEAVAGLKAKYCIGDDVIAALDQRTRDGKPPAVYWVHYHAGPNGWQKGPAATFRLRIEKPSPGAMIATCFAGVKPSDDGSALEWRASDRTDESDIEIFFVE